MLRKLSSVNEFMSPTSKRKLILLASHDLFSLLKLIFLKRNAKSRVSISFSAHIRFIIGQLFKHDMVGNMAI